VIFGAYFILLLLSYVIINGGVRLRLADKKIEPFGGISGDLPDVTVIVPVSGASDVIENGLRSILKQDYPRYEVVFSTQYNDESAGILIHKLMSETNNGQSCRIKHALSRFAKKCGQKNKNMLTALATIEPFVSVLVFCDAGHILPSCWLRNLVAPIALDNRVVTTSYHHVIPADNRIGTLGHTTSVFFLYFLQMIPFLCQPWGGGTAIRRDVFEQLNVLDTWKRKVVDDVSLAGLLQRAGIRVTLVPSAVSITPLSGQTVSGWSTWMTRQLMYLKLFYPVTWFLSGVAGFASAYIVVTMAGKVLLDISGMMPVTTVYACMAWIVLLVALLLIPRRLHPATGSQFKWVVAGTVAIFVVCWCHFKTWFARNIAWKGNVYHVARNGDVLGIRR
jgi:ceramide glucosyltransferase